MDVGELDASFVGRGVELAEILSCAADPDVAGVLLVAEYGAGKTELARHASAALTADGWRTEWVAASRSAASVPFSAVARLLPPQWRGDGPPVWVLRAIEERVRAERTAICVDDAHLLDDASATVIGHLAASRAAFVLLTAEAGVAVPDALAAIARRRLPALCTVDVDRLVDQALGEVDGVTRALLRRSSAGNPLAVREAIRLGLAGRALRQRYGVWTWDAVGPGEHGTSPGGGVAERLRALTPTVRRLLELVALGEPVPLAVVERVADAAAVRSAEDDGLIEVERVGGRPRVRLAHPVFGVALRAGLSIPRARRGYRSLVRMAGRPPLCGPGDLPRAGWWQVAADLVVDPKVVASSAREALQRMDLRLAERLAAAARDRAPGPDADRLLARILCARGRAVEAMAVLGDEAPSGPAYARWAVTRAVALYCSTGDRVAAIAALPVEADPAGAARVVILLSAGACADAYAVATRALDRPGTSTRDSLVAAAAATAAAGFLGRTAALTRAHQRGAALAVTAECAAPLEFAAGLGRLAAGELSLAAELAAGGYRAAVEAGVAVPAGAWAALRGLVAAGQGRFGDAAPALREAAALLDDDDASGIVRLCLTCLGAASALTGEVRAGRTWLERADRRTGHRAGLLAPWEEQWRAWVVAATRSATAAIPVAANAARLARAAGMPTVEAAALFDVVRLGGSAPGLVGLAAELGTPTAAAMALAATGLSSADGDLLGRAATAFADLGHQLLAAECAAAAGRAYRRSGRCGSAQVYAETAALLRGRCGGVRTPLLDLNGATEVLTPREREVLLLAAGHTGPEIAERLGLSLRTVNNNLARAYAKLGVSGRAELRALLGHGPARAPRRHSGRPAG